LKLLTTGGGVLGSGGGLDTRQLAQPGQCPSSFSETCWVGSPQFAHSTVEFAIFSPSLSGREAKSSVLVVEHTLIS
jgi:hypothetical protein